MTKSKARDLLGLRPTDVCLKEGLESLKQCEVELYKRTLDTQERKRIKLWVKAIDTLLKSEDYYKEEM